MYMDGVVDEGLDYEAGRLGGPKEFPFSPSNHSNHSYVGFFLIQGRVFIPTIISSCNCYHLQNGSVRES